MEIRIDPAKFDAFERQIPALAPWMHAFRFGPKTLVGFYKYEGIGLELTCCTSQSAPGDIEKLNRAYALRRHSEHFEFFEQMSSVIPSAERQRMTVVDFASATGELSFWAINQGFGRVVSSEIRGHQVAQQRLIVDSVVDDDWRRRIEVIHEPVSADAPELVDRYAPMKPDVVFSFGLLYHLVNPVQHLRNLYDITQRYAFIHTQTHALLGAEMAWILTLEDASVITKGLGGVNWAPHFHRMPWLLERIGFRNVRTVYPARFAKNFPGFDRYDRPTRVHMRVANLVRRFGYRIGHQRNYDEDYYRYSGLNPNYFGYIAEK